MPMNVNCKFFESRTYPNGETVRKCDIDLAPEAPWRCPENCRGFQPRLADVNWQHGSLVVAPTPPEPASLGSDDSIAALLDSAEDIVNAVAPEALAEAELRRQREAKARGGAGSKVSGATGRATGAARKLFGRFRRR